MIDLKIRSWLMSAPGLFTAETPQEVLELAFVACTNAMGALACDLEQFRAGLDRSGFVVDIVRKGCYRLALPSTPIEGPNHFNVPRLSVIRDRRSGLR